MKVSKTTLDDVLVIDPESFPDHRGEYIETFNKASFGSALRAFGMPVIDENRLREFGRPPVEFVQDDYSCSILDVLRGVHGDAETWKLVYCPIGTIFLAVVNWDANSPQYRQWETFTISGVNHRQVLIPPKFGNGHLVLSDQAIFAYKQSTYYGEFPQFTIPWNSLGIPWPCRNPILSERDANA